MKKIIIISFFLLVGFIPSLITHNWDNPFTRSNEFLIDTNIVYVPVNGSYPSVAFDGTNYLVVWKDTRYTKVEEGVYSHEYYDIFGARVNQSGKLIDSAGIPISINPHYQSYPDIAHGEHNFLVVWSDGRNDTSLDIYGTRIDTSGTVLDTSSIIISTDEYDQSSPSIAFGIDSYLVVWANGNLGGIRGVRVGKNGSILDTASIEISSFWGWQMFPDISFDGTNFFVVWYSQAFGNNILGALVDTSGNLLDTTDIPVCMHDYEQIYPSVAFDGSKYLVVWRDERNYMHSIFGARVDTSGFVLDTAGIPIYPSWYVWDKPSIAYGEKTYLLLFREEGHYIKCIRIDTSGTIIDTSGILISSNSYGPPVVTFDGTNFLAAWSYKGIKGTRIDTSATLLDSSFITISKSAYYQWSPSSVFDGKNYFVVWQDKRNGEDYDIYGAWVDTTGVIIDSNCISISTEIVNQQFPKVAYSGSNYLVVWQDDRYGNIYGARVDTTGTVLDSSGITISGAPSKQEKPSIAFDGKHYFVVWLDERDPNDIAIYGTRVDTSGSVLDPAGIQISFAQWGSEFNPSIAFNGNDYLIIWCIIQKLQGAIVDTSGQIKDTLNTLENISSLYYSSVASDGADYFVVWQDSRNPSLDIYGARIDSSGTVLDTAGIPISTALGNQEDPTVSFDGTDYIVLWEDYRDVETNIHGARVSTAGIVLDTFAVVTQEGNQFSPALAKGPGDKFLLTYSGFVDSINSRPANTMRIWGKLFTPPVGVKEDEPISKPFRFFLKQNVPNPVFSETVIKYTIPENSEVSATLIIYNAVGQKVKTLVDENQSPSHYKVRWDCKDNKGKPVPSGIYFYRLTAGEKTAIKKMVVLR